MLISEDTLLKELLDGKRMNVSSFIHIAIALAEAVLTEHKRYGAVRHLNPTCIRMLSERDAAVLGENTAADVAYLSPEQTGRINRTPDERSNLYALGVMYYEMLAGHLPFHAQSDEEWVHAHLAIVPKPLCELRSEVPVSLSDIIMKLLAKTPEERYQHATGLLVDLKQCRLSQENTGIINEFEIARLEESSRFKLPGTLFGREKEADALRSAFEQIRTGSAAFVIVTGRAGIGKTALIRELQMPVIYEGGKFISGKCDLMNRDIPFSPILQALRKLLRQIWSEPTERIAKLKAHLAEELGQGAGVIAALLPEASALLGDFPPVEPLPPAEAAIRFRRLFPLFMKNLSSKEHPLVLFLDDLQWADPATMDVLRTLAHDPTLQGLLVIGAFREETALHLTEQGQDHAAAAAWIEEALSLLKEEELLRVRHITLDPLSYTDVKRFTSIVIHENTDRVRLLAEPLYQRTGGNPLYLHRFLDGLFRERKLYYEEELTSWVWDTDSVNQMPEDPDIHHLISSRLRMLPSETIVLLGMAGAASHRFRLAMIARVCELSLSDARKFMLPAEKEGLIWREDDTEESEADAEDCYYTFVHDRVQQVAYRTIPESDRAALHLRIGRVLQGLEFDQKEESIFDKVYHLNLGSTEMVDKTEQRELAAYNLQAGLKSKASTAFSAALHFLEKGLSLIGGNEEGTDSLSYRLLLELPECEYMCGRIERAEELLDQLMTRTTDLIERSRIYLIRIAMHAYLRNEELAVEIGLQSLAEFGWEIPVKPSKAALLKDLTLTRFALYKSRHELLGLPINRDPVYRAVSDLFMAISASAFVTNTELSALLNCQLVRYGLKHGNNEAFTYMLGAYGVMLTFAFPRSGAGSRLTKIAYGLSTRFESLLIRGRLHVLMGLAGQYRSPQEAVGYFEKAVGYGLEANDSAFVGYAMELRILNHSGDLYALSAFLTEYEEKFGQLLDKETLMQFRIARMYMAEMQGESGALDAIGLPVQEEQVYLSQKNQVFHYCTCKMETDYLAERYQQALKWVNISSYHSFETKKIPLQSRKQHVYETLSMAALYAEAPQEERKGIRDALSKQLRSMKQWSGYLGSESSAYLLITAELKRIEGDRAAAAKWYDEAIAEARREEYGLMEAISCERASMFYRDAGSVTGAGVLMADAYAAYWRWGATAKARKLRAAYPGLPASASAQQDDVAIASGESDGVRASERSELKSSKELVPDKGQEEAAGESVVYTGDEKQAIRQIAEWSSAADSEEIMLRYLDAALRYTGAVKGCILSCQEDQFAVVAECGAFDRSEESPYAAAIVRYVVRTGEPIVLADASNSVYAADPYIRRSHSLSILCMPVLFPGNSLPSVLLLENSLMSGVFNYELLEVLDMMMARMVYLKSLTDSRSRVNETKDSETNTLPTNAEQTLIDTLTSRETEILYALSEGLSNKEIAIRFGITEATVKSHVFRLYGKLEVKRRGQAIARARALQLMV
ncbi:AAA family ATPase [Paenibacillus sp. OV219]|uniref:AAA family ATPase n=1 Tax=Paenibacillus sp. OV219 TaxID=1884377 RepID=UPI0008CD8ACC|nr:AAA family ATPase [Paenibacillus sp. OV219]SEM62644.1 Predicted ATPase [Paenibacillus sp. OV219]